MKKIIFFIISFLLSTHLFALEKIKEVGRVEFVPKTNGFVFYFVKDNKVQSILIRPSDKTQFELLKKQQNKAILLEGEIKPYVKTGESFVYQEEMSNAKLQELNKELLNIDTKKLITQFNLLSHEKKSEKIKAKGTGIEITDKSANSIIAIAGTLVGIAAGPIAILPAAAYLINEKINN